MQRFHESSGLFHNVAYRSFETGPQCVKELTTRLLRGGGAAGLNT